MMRSCATCFLLPTHLDYMHLESTPIIHANQPRKVRKPLLLSLSRLLNLPVPPSPLKPFFLAVSIPLFQECSQVSEYK